MICENEKVYWLPFQFHALFSLFLSLGVNLGQWIPINVSVQMFYEKADFFCLFVSNRSLTQWTLKTFKLDNTKQSWRQTESSHLKLMNKPSMTPPLVLIRLTASANWSRKHKNWKRLNLTTFIANKRVWFQLMCIDGHA